MKGPQCFVRIKLDSASQRLMLKNTLIAQTQVENELNNSVNLDEEGDHLKRIKQSNQKELPQQKSIENKSLKQLIKSKQFQSKNPKANIDMYLECDDCQTKLTEQIRLKKMHLEYSFYRFLQRLFLTQLTNGKQQNGEKWLVNKLPFQDGCRHLTISRVFVFEGTKVKFYSNIFQCYGVQFFSMSSEGTQQELERQIQDQIEQRKVNLIKVIEEITEMLKQIIKRGIKQMSSSTNLNTGMIASTTDMKLSLSTNNKIENQKTLLISKLVELSQNAIKYLQSQTFKDILMFEYESQKLFVKFQEMQITIKQKLKQRNNNEAFGNFMHLFRPPASTAENIPKNEGVPSKNGMLSFLINTKNIDKELRTTHSRKKTDIERLKKEEKSLRQQIHKQKTAQMGPDQFQKSLPDTNKKPRGSLKPEAMTPKTLPHQKESPTTARQESTRQQENNVFTLKELPGAKRTSSQDGSEIIDEKAIQFDDKLNETEDLNKLDQFELFFQNNENPNLPENNQQTEAPPQIKINREFSLKKLWPRYTFNFNEKPDNKYLYPFIPLSEEYDIPLLAYALNTQLYYNQIYLQEGFVNFEGQTFPDPNNKKQFEFISKKLLSSGTKNESESVLNVKINIETFTIEWRYPEQEQKKSLEGNQLNSIQEIQEEGVEQKNSILMSPLEENLSSEKPATITGQSDFFASKNDIIPQQPQQIPVKQPKLRMQADITLYYPTEFEALRMMNNISLSQMIKSFANCIPLDATGGKSGATFFRSEDNLFVFKAVKDSEFFMFTNFGPAYFEHMFKHSYENKPSVLIKIFGMFEKKNKNGNVYYIVMENLFYGMPGERTVYDLKGSEAKRWNKKGGSTLLDTNFIIDQNGEPLPVIKNNYDYISEAFILDSEFLQRCDVVDYSLLVVLDRVKNRLKLGIIDYLQQYTLAKQAETRFKKLINLGQDPTILPPPNYKKRFLEAMDKYFMETKGSL